MRLPAFTAALLLQLLLFSITNGLFQKIKGSTPSKSRTSTKGSLSSRLKASTKDPLRSKLKTSPKNPLLETLKATTKESSFFLPKTFPKETLLSRLKTSAIRGWSFSRSKAPTSKPIIIKKYSTTASSSTRRKTTSSSLTSASRNKRRTTSTEALVHSSKLARQGGFAFKKLVQLDGISSTRKRRSTTTATMTTSATSTTSPRAYSTVRSKEHTTSVQTVKVIKNDAGDTPSSSMPARSTRGRHLNAYKADKGMFPFVARVQIAESEECLGALISRSWVVTAANCFSSEKATAPTVKIALGDHDKLIPEPEEQWFTARSIVRHPGFDVSGRLENDIALVQLDGLAEVSRYVKPVSLPRKSIGDDICEVGTALAWGLGRAPRRGDKGDIMHRADVALYAAEHCKKLGISVVEGQICAGYPDSRKLGSFRNPIAGSPVVCPQPIVEKPSKRPSKRQATSKEDSDIDSLSASTRIELKKQKIQKSKLSRRSKEKKPVLCGITSKPERRGGDLGENPVAVFTRIAHYLPWMRRTIKGFLQSNISSVAARASHHAPDSKPRLNVVGIVTTVPQTTRTTTEKVETEAETEEAPGSKESGEQNDEEVETTSTSTSKTTTTTTAMPTDEPELPSPDPEPEPDIETEETTKAVKRTEAPAGPGNGVEGAYPFLGILEARASEENRELLSRSMQKRQCASILLGQSFALSAAQCFASEDGNLHPEEYMFQVRFGSEAAKNGTFQSIPIQDTFLFHPDTFLDDTMREDGRDRTFRQRNRVSQANKAVVLQLQSSVIYSQHAFPINLPTTDDFSGMSAVLISPKFGQNRDRRTASSHEEDSLDESDHVQFNSARFKIVDIHHCPKNQLILHNLHEHNAICAQRLSGGDCKDYMHGSPLLCKASSAPSKYKRTITNGTYYNKRRPRAAPSQSAYVEMYKNNGLFLCGMLAHSVELSPDKRPSFMVIQNQQSQMKKRNEDKDLKSIPLLSEKEQMMRRKLKMGVTIRRPGKKFTSLLRPPTPRLRKKKKSRNRQGKGKVKGEGSKKLKVKLAKLHKKRQASPLLEEIPVPLPESQEYCVFRKFFVSKLIPRQRKGVDSLSSHTLGVFGNPYL